MKQKKRNYIITFILLNLILIPWIVIHNDFCFDKIIKYSKELAIFEFSTISLIIAISLFDQFGLNKKLTEKRVELIIELLTELKKQEGFGSHYKVNKSFRSNPSFYFEKNMALVQSQRYSNNEYLDNLLNTKILIELTDFDIGFKGVRRVLNNPIMPKSILDKAQFLSIGGGSRSINDDPEELLYLYFTSEGKKKLVEKDTKYWTFSSKNNCTLIEFLKKFDALFKACEDWTNNHSNMDEELNLKNF